MRDTLGRDIHYLRISLTDRCNLRCRYCLPQGTRKVRHDDILRYEEIRDIARAAVAVGIDTFKITGGEPLVRKGVADGIRMLHEVPGVREVTLTTNGQLLEGQLPALIASGVRAVNISLDTLDAEQYKSLTGGELAPVLAAIRAAVKAELRVKINAVLLKETASQLLPLAQLAAALPLDVRFIELMPIGCGRLEAGVVQDRALMRLCSCYPDLTLTSERRGNGPAVYYKSKALRGRIGFIAANTHRFCSSCNRLRLTSMGFLKPCLCYAAGIDLRAIVRSGRPDREEALREAFREAIRTKPDGHRFTEENKITERKTMNEIGG